MANGPALDDLSPQHRTKEALQKELPKADRRAGGASRSRPRAAVPDGAESAGPIRPATPEEVMQAWEGLSVAQRNRLRKHARVHAWGSEYYEGRAEELIMDAVHGAYVAAATEGEEGRTWCLNVRFMAYLQMSIKGRASDARDNAYRRYTVRDGKVHEGSDPVDPLAAILREELARLASDTLDKICRDDLRIAAIIHGLLNDLTAREIQTAVDMTRTEYESARRQLLRQLARIRSKE
jgi:hypothetical protein